MRPAEGKAPPQTDTPERKYLLDKLTDVRKSCEWLVTLGAANVFANLLKSDTSHITWLRTPTLVIVGVEMCFALVGAVAYLADIDPANAEERLASTLKTRYLIRNIALFLLVAAFVMLLLQIM